MELRPKEQIKAQRRTERTMTTLVSKLVSGPPPPPEMDWSGLWRAEGAAAVKSFLE